MRSRYGRCVVTIASKVQVARRTLNHTSAFHLSVFKWRSRLARDLLDIVLRIVLRWGKLFVGIEQHGIVVPMVAVPVTPSVLWGVIHGIDRCEQIGYQGPRPVG